VAAAGDEDKLNLTTGAVDSRPYYVNNTTERANMKKRYIVPVIIVSLGILFFVMYFVIKWLLPLPPNAEFHFEETEEVILDDYYEKWEVPYSLGSWVMYDERTFLLDSMNVLAKIDADSKTVVSRVDFPEDEWCNGVIIRENGNILKQLYSRDHSVEDDGIQTFNFREFTPDLEFIRDIPIAEGIFSIEIIGDTVYAIDSDKSKYYTMDENLNILTEMTVNIDIEEGYTVSSQNIIMGADGKPYIRINCVKWAETFSNERVSLEKDYITSFEPDPSAIIELPGGGEWHGYMGFVAGDEDYPFYATLFDVVDSRFWINILQEDSERYAIMGINPDGTSKKVSNAYFDVGDEKRPTHIRDTAINVFVFIFGKYNYRDGVIYDLTTRDSKIILKKYTKVYN
jgi:hypothetical protein